MKKIINAIIIIGYIWLSFILIYNTVLPQEYKDAIPFLNSLGVLFSGLSTGAISSVLIYIKTFVNKSERYNLDIIKDLVNQINALDDLFNKLEVAIKNQGANINQLNNEKIVENENKKELLQENKELVKLIKLYFQSKATNPLIDKDIEKQIKEVLGDEEKLD